MPTPHRIKASDGDELRAVNFARLFRPALYQLKRTEGNFQDRNTRARARACDRWQRRGKMKTRVQETSSPPGDWAHRRGTWLGTCAALGLMILLGALSAPATAVTPESPEVKKLVNSALTYLENNPEDRLGGRCLVGMAFVKAKRPDHPRVREAIQACQDAVRANAQEVTLDIYNNGLAIIFLCELAPETYAREIEWFLGRVKGRQKSHGGFGYLELGTGDTSQTQYAALSYWEAYRRGFRIEAESVENLTDWLLRTQSPEGCWGYQGHVSPTSTPIQQYEMNCSMLAAGLGSLYICTDTLGLQLKVQFGDFEGEQPQPLPEGLRPIGKALDVSADKRLRPKRTNPSHVREAMKKAHDWMKENYTIDIGTKSFYYLYGLERYKSFQEAFEGLPVEEPKWYNDGYEFLLAEQQPDGSWEGYCGKVCDTAFAVLFLLRSTQKSIQARLGEGTLLAGRGLPPNLARAKMRNGQLIVEQVHTKVEELLSMVDGEDEGALDELARDPRQLVITKVDEQSARRLEQLVRGGEPEVRLLATRALGRTGDLDYVPTLLYALTDPDRRVVLQARDSLRFISRNFDGFGPPDDFVESQRFEALDAWKKWYLSLRPTAVLDL
jgi:hypothetical protein